MPSVETMGGWPTHFQIATLIVIVAGLAIGWFITRDK